MQIFKDNKKSLALLGIHLPRSANKIDLFNWRNLLVLICFTLATLFIGLFFVFGNGTVSEYSAAIYGFNSAAISFFLLMTFVWKSEKVHKLIRQFEEIVEKREFSFEIRFITRSCWIVMNELIFEFCGSVVLGSKLR